MRWLLWCFCLLVESYETINHYHFHNTNTQTYHLDTISRDGENFRNEKFAKIRLRVIVPIHLQITSFNTNLVSHTCASSIDILVAFRATAVVRTDQVDTFFVLRARVRSAFVDFCKILGFQ